jgi:hypothetical protein
MQEPTNQSNVLVVRHQKRKDTRQQGGRADKPYQSRVQDQDSDQDDNDEIECWYCYKKWHVKIDCRLKKQADENCRKREKHEAKASLAAAIEAPKTTKEALISNASIW